jgi:hypothetical protein
MTTKPKTRKAPAAETGINPKLAALAAKLDEVHTHARRVEARQTGDYDVDAEEDACAHFVKTSTKSRPRQFGSDDFGGQHLPKCSVLQRPSHPSSPGCVTYP